MKQFVWFFFWWVVIGLSSVSAQESLKIKFRSRALLDAMVSGYGKEDVQGYYRLEDFRVGSKPFMGIGKRKLILDWAVGKWQ